jgi:hypothetical protein
MASIGTIPKCSLAGVYKRAWVDAAVRSAVRWDVEKLSRKSTSGSTGVPFSGGIWTEEEEEVMTLNVSEFALAKSIKP